MRSLSVLGISVVWLTILAPVVLGAAQPTPLPTDFQTITRDVRAIERTLTETRAELERTRALAQSAWDGTTLTLFGVLVGIGLAFMIEHWYRKPHWVAVGIEIGAFIVTAFAIRFLDDQLVNFMRWLVG